MTRTWLFFDDEHHFAKAAATHVGRLGRAAVTRNGFFSLALSGGRSPVRFFSFLADEVIFPKRLWTCTHVFFADERCVSPQHPDSNFLAANTHLLNHVPIPAPNIHRMRGENTSEDEAKRYARELRAVLDVPDHATPSLDLAVLGMGADGHTASLFPGSTDPPPATLVAAVPAPAVSPSVPRLTLTPSVLNAAKNIMFLVLGEDKHPALGRLQNGATELPAASVDVRPQSWYVCPPLPATL